MSEERFNEIDRRFDHRFSEVNHRFDRIDRRFELRTAETVDWRRHMGVLHEDVVHRIRGIGEDDSLRQEVRAGFAMIMKRLDDHAIPGEAADRAFAATLGDHEKRITSLERAKSVRGLKTQQVTEAQGLVEEHIDDIRRAWAKHFPSRSDQRFSPRFLAVRR